VVAQWLGCCATNRKVAGLIPAGVSGFFIDKISFLSHYDLGVDSVFNLLAPELFFKILAHPVYKMWIIQEPNMLELWNKLHFEEEKTDSIYHVKNIKYLYL